MSTRPSNWPAIQAGTGADNRPGIRTGTGAPRWIEPLLPHDAAGRHLVRVWIVRILVATNLALATYYIAWRWTASINWTYVWAWLALILAETSGYIGAWLFGLTLLRLRRRAEPAPPAPGATADVFIICYDEPVELVRATTRAAVAIRYPHTTYVLDDRDSPAMRAMAVEEGVGYIVRSLDWQGRERPARAHSLNTALVQTTGQYIAILDADQIPTPGLVDRTLGHFRDPTVALVQMPLIVDNAPAADPLGTRAALFHGPIQQGKDGWDAALYCGTNAVLRREALVQMGIRHYPTELTGRVRQALTTAERLLIRAAARRPDSGERRTEAALAELRAAIDQAWARLRADRPIQEVTWRVQQQAERIVHALTVDRVAHAAPPEDLAAVRRELAAIAGLAVDDLVVSLADALDDPARLAALTRRSISPLAAIELVCALLLSVDVDRDDETQPPMPLATIAVTDCVAITTRLQAMGWRSVYHDEILAHGLAPDDLRAALQQRLRWAQGAIQVLLRENPLGQPRLSLGQRLMFVATVWPYLAGFTAPIYLGAPVLYLLLGVLPVKAFSADLFWHLLPYVVINQLLIRVAGWGLPTWRGQRDSLALFPLWIKAVQTACAHVWSGATLGAIAPPKARLAGSSPLDLISWQLVAMGWLIFAAAIGLAKLAFGLTDDGVPILIAVLWVIHNLLMVSAALDAAVYRAPSSGTPTDRDAEISGARTAAEAHGRQLAGAER